MRFRHAFVRGLLGVVEIWLTFGTVALIASLASAKGRRIGDYLAGTVVVHERVPVRAAPVAAMPPQLVGWAQQLDLSRVPDDLALPPGSSWPGPPSCPRRCARRWGRRWPARWPRSPRRPRPPAYRPGHSCRRCSPSGGAARCCGSAALPRRTAAGAGPPPPPPPSYPPPPPSHCRRRRRCQRRQRRRLLRATSRSPRRPER